MNPTASMDDTSRTERLLWAAADFEPEEPAPVGLAFRALAGRRRRRNIRARRLIAQGACTFACVVAALLLWPTREAPLPVDMPPVVEPAKVPTPKAGAVRARPKQPPKQQQKLVQGAGPSTPAATRPTRAWLPRHHHWRERRIRREPESSKPLWRTEVVRRTTTGVLAPAWVAGPGAGGGAMEVTPAVLDVPLGDEDGGPGAGPASYTEENP